MAGASCWVLVEAAMMAGLCATMMAGLMRDEAAAAHLLETADARSAGWTWVLAFLLAGCATLQPTTVRTYDFGSSMAAAHSPVRLAAPISIPQVSAPGWLRGPALVYRLGYLVPPRPQIYALSRWVAPPAELITLRLRERVAAVNAGFTVSGLDGDANGYLLEVTLEQFSQVFESPMASRCTVQLRATLAEPGGRILA